MTEDIKSTSLMEDDTENGGATVSDVDHGADNNTEITTVTEVFDEDVNDPTEPLEELANEPAEPYVEASDEPDGASDENTYEPMTEVATEDYDFDEDISELADEFPEGDIGKILENERYAALRQLGLTPKEAYLACGGTQKVKTAVPKSPISVTRRHQGIPDRDLRMAREIFTSLTDREIKALYMKVTKN